MLSVLLITFNLCNSFSGTNSLISHSLKDSNNRVVLETFPTPPAALLLQHDAIVRRTETTTNPCAHTHCAHLCVIRPQNLTDEDTEFVLIVFYSFVFVSKCHLSFPSTFCSQWSKQQHTKSKKPKNKKKQQKKQKKRPDPEISQKELLAVCFYFVISSIFA